MPDKNRTASHLGSRKNERCSCLIALSLQRTRPSINGSTPDLPGRVLAVQRRAVNSAVLIRCRPCIRRHHGSVTAVLGNKRQAVEPAQLGNHQATPTELALCPVGDAISISVETSSTWRRRTLHGSYAARRASANSRAVRLTCIWGRHFICVFVTQKIYSTYTFKRVSANAAVAV